MSDPSGSGIAAAPADARRVAPIVRSEGQRMFTLVEGTVAAIGRELGVRSFNSICDWRSGRKMPSVEARAKIQSAFGIPALAWSVKPGAVLPDGTTDASTAPEPLATTSSPSTLADCLALLAVLRRDRVQVGLAPSDRVRLSDAEARVLALRARLEQAQELAEDRYVYEHPAWRRLKRAIVDALEPHPAAALAVRDAIARVTHDDDDDRVRGNSP
jgi:transcriptional regulator with XRE-family HTH domain